MPEALPAMTGNIPEGRHHGTKLKGGMATYTHRFSDDSCRLIPMNCPRLSCFGAYDIRGIVPNDLNEETAYRIGRSYASLFKPDKVVVGKDVRLSSTSLSEALERGLNDGGCDVLDIGLCGTEQVYFTTFHLGLDGGIMVTASHNPAVFNGMKFVRQQAIPVSGDSGLRQMEALVATASFPRTASKGKTRAVDMTDMYVNHLLTYIDAVKLKPFTIACNPGNGSAGPVIQRLKERLPLTILQINEEPDGTFPNGVPNPLLPENREATSRFVRDVEADIGLAWDGDFDRCFFFDERGSFIEGYYIVGLLAGAVLKTKPHTTIIHDPRLIWNTIEIVREMSGRPVQSRTGHAFMKEKMRAEDAAYGGEMSSHHYFREFAYCDSGMIPWLIVLQTMSQQDKPLSALVQERMERYPVSGEINRTPANPDATLAKILERYGPSAAEIDYTDGISMAFERWRFNIRKSNTEPLVRINLETRGDRKLLIQKLEEILSLVG